MTLGFVWLTHAATAKRVRLPLSKLRDFERCDAGARLRLNRGAAVEVRETPDDLTRLIAAAPSSAAAAAQKPF